MASRGAKCQLDFGYLGLLADPVSGRQREVHALIFTACYSRHMFVWLSYTQNLAAFLAGSQAAWAFFGGVFKVLVPTMPRRSSRTLLHRPGRRPEAQDREQPDRHERADVRYGTQRQLLSAVPAESTPASDPARGWPRRSTGWR